MASVKTSSHVRSISLPTTSHPLDASIEDHFRRLRATEVSPSSSSSISQNLCIIKDLYQHMDDLIHLPHNQVVLSNEPHKSEVEEVLDGSLTLLDTSSSALDALSQMKGSILDLKSALRRGSNEEGIRSYEMSRKKISKALCKCLASLKKAEKSRALKESQNVENTVRNLKEAESISLTTLKSLVSYLIGKKAVSQTRGWSLVAKLVNSTQVSLNSKNATELENVDDILSKNAEMKVVMQQLETLELVIYELENGLESVSKCLIRSRVSLLNVLNH